MVDETLHGPIENGVPIPTKRRWRWPRFEVLDELEVGQSVVFKVDSRGFLSTPIDFREKRDGKKFKTQSLHTGGIRVWRTA